MIDLHDLVKEVPNFPKEGVLFRDISPLLKERFAETIDAMSSLFSNQEWEDVDVLAGIESRGFIFASALAYKHRKGFVKIRKPGKLPNIADQIDYGLEYNQSTLEMQKGDHTRLFILDDLMATGGSMGAAAELAQRVGYRVMGLAALVNLESLNNFTWQGMACRSFLKF